MFKNENKRDFFILTNKCYVPEQHSRDFSRRLSLGNANASGTIAFKSYNLKSS